MRTALTPLAALMLLMLAFGCTQEQQSKCAMCRMFPTRAAPAVTPTVAATPTAAPAPTQAPVAVVVDKPTPGPVGSPGTVGSTDVTVRSALRVHRASLDNQGSRVLEASVASRASLDP
jgi:hypothetical protein